MLKGNSALLARIVVGVPILWTLPDVMTRFFTPFADVALRQLLYLLETRFWLPQYSLTAVARGDVLLLWATTRRLIRLSHARLLWVRSMLTMVAP